MKEIAHIKQIEHNWYFHSVEEHLIQTSLKVKKFSDLFNSGDWGEVCGLLHDIGKYSDLFQKRIKLASGYEENKNSTVTVADHSTAGAQYAIENYGNEIGRILAYIISGHHSGLPNGNDNEISCLTDRLKKVIPAYLEKLPDFLKHFPNLNHKNLPCSSRPSGFSISFTIRMLFSCLVDADFLDTESFMDPKNSEIRSANENKFEDLLLKLNTKLGNFKLDKGINSIRNNILKDCIVASSLDPGFFSLTVPTGGGKTLSSMSFAINHAIKYGKKRIIYVIPYTSIIEQNADVFREVFGNKAILEHHSNYDSSKFDDESLESYLRLTAQNWDAQIIVTTNVQFFESLFSNKPSACRKLHNIVNSVIILDEAQMLPVDLLKPSLEALKELVRGYGCSIVLCSATQPAVNSSDLKGGIDIVREIINKPRELDVLLKRTEVKYIGKLADNELINRISESKQVLIIVSNKKHAKKIFELTPGENKFHLSSLMCPEHRAEKIKAIKENLKAGKDCRVVSTQLIEAGVDVDFPVVYRSIAGADSISQSAGRCNREGKLETGYVYVFEPEEPSFIPPGFLRHCAQIGKQVIGRYENPVCLEAIKEYFMRLYWQKTDSLDRKNIIDKLNENVCKLDIPFKDISKLFKIIDQNTKSIIIPYGTKGKELYGQIRSNYFFPNKEFMQKLQRFTVQVHPHSFDVLNSSGSLESFFDESLYLLLNPDIYNDDLGLLIDNPYFYEVDTLII